MRTVHVISALAAVCAALAQAAPVVENGGFEEDRFANRPGYASDRMAITGWEWEGNAGINPFWEKHQNRHVPIDAFTDNGIIPEGRQVVFLQNDADLKQPVEGFEAGKHYQVLYRENGRHNNMPENRPTLEVRLGDEVVVSRHPVKAVDEVNQRQHTWYFVESAVFTPDADGAYELVFDAEGERTAVLIDDVKIVEAGQQEDQADARQE